MTRIEPSGRRGRSWWVTAALLCGCSELRDDGHPFGEADQGPDVGTTDDEGKGGEADAAADGPEGETGQDPPRFDLGDDGGIDTQPDSGGGCEQDIDIVFVMDVSTSMGPFLATLADEVLVVDQTIADLGLPNPPHYGLVVFVDDTLVVAGGQAYPDIESLRAEFLEWSAFTSSNEQVAGGNPNSTWPENSLDALFGAATEFAWRPAGEQTLRMIIHTTDDTFWDGPTVGNGVAIEHGYEEVVSALQEREIRMFTFAADIGGQCECENVRRGWSKPYMDMPAIPKATDGEAFDLELVRAGQLSLSSAITGVVAENMCDPYPPQG
jgi:hypothetical protein